MTLAVLEARFSCGFSEVWVVAFKRKKKNYFDFFFTAATN